MWQQKSSIERVHYNWYLLLYIKQIRIVIHIAYIGSSVELHLPLLTGKRSLGLGQTLNFSCAAQT